MMGIHGGQSEKVDGHGRAPILWHFNKKNGGKAWDNPVIDGNSAAKN